MGVAKIMVMQRLLVQFQVMCYSSISNQVASGQSKKLPDVHHFI